MAIYKSEGDMDMREIKSVELGFENCEVLSVPVKFIGWLELNEVKVKNHMVKTNGIEFRETKEISKFVLVINRGFEAERGAFLTNWSIEKPLTRIISYNDVTSVKINYTDETSEDFYVKYVGTSEAYFAENVLQKSKRNSYGDVFLTIGNFEEDFFMDDLIEHTGFLKNTLMFKENE